MKKPRLGERYRDPLSGFEGTADARCEYLHGEPQLRLVAETGPTGDEKKRWFPEDALADAQPRGAGFAP